MEAKNIPGITVTNNELSLIAACVSLEPAALKAVQIVETGGRSGFVSRQHPTILFEGHIFWRELEHKGINPKLHLNGNENILYPKWDNTKYYGGLKEYERLKAACAIDTEAALLSTSWGMFQILGLNYKKCGEPDIRKFVRQMTYSEFHQINLAVVFMDKAGLIPLLNSHKWAAFAKRYNGPAYAKNHYDTRLKDAYMQSKQIFK